MINSSLDVTSYTGHIVLKPNQSMSWHENKFFLITLTFISISISSGFLMLGAWMIFPFAGLELLALYITVIYFLNHQKRCEVIIFNDDTVVIELGKTCAEQSFEYSRHWSKFHVSMNQDRNIPTVWIRSHGHETELGSFLGQEDKIELIQILREITRGYKQIPHGEVN